MPKQLNSMFLGDDIFGIVTILNWKDLKYFFSFSKRHRWFRTRCKLVWGFLSKSAGGVRESCGKDQIQKLYCNGDWLSPQLMIYETAGLTSKVAFQLQFFKTNVIRQYSLVLLVQKVLSGSGHATRRWSIPHKAEPSFAPDQNRTGGIR